jgi:hypothetical protein
VEPVTPTEPITTVPVEVTVVLLPDKPTLPEGLDNSKLVMGQTLLALGPKSRPVVALRK